MTAPINSAPMSLAPGSPTGPRSGLLYLRESVKAYFAAFGVEAEVPPVGLKYRSFNLNSDPATGGNRVVLIPGDFDGSGVPKARPYGLISKDVPHGNSGFNPIEIGSWARIFTISIWGAQPPGKEQDPSAALEICENLLEQVVRAVMRTPVNGIATTGAFELGEVFDNSPVENAFGCELLVKATMISPLFDITYAVAQGEMKSIERTFP